MLGAGTSLKMESDVSAVDMDSIDWDTDDELEVFGAKDSSPSNPSTTDNLLVNGEVVQEQLESNTEAGSSHGKLIDYFVKMGFKEDMVYKAILEAGKDVDEPESAILETLLTYSTLANSEDLQFLESSSEALEKSPEEQCRNDYNYNYNLCSSDYEDCNGFSDMDVWSDNELEENGDRSSEKDKILHSLSKMGYSVSEASIALERCGPNASISELTDCICAHQLAREQDLYLPDDKPRAKPSNGECAILKKRKMFAEMHSKKKPRGPEAEEMLRLPNPMVGFGLPSHPECVTQRTLPEQAIGPPYFYYENVALTPKGVWETISRFLYNVEPEFVDSKYFCAAARKRGYVHNLPIHNRFPLIPTPPFTIHDAFPLTRRWWPTWDTRTKLNCLQTAIGSAKLQERIRKAIEDYHDEPPPVDVQKYVTDQCRKWNLVWVGRNKVAPLEPDEVEILLGFPKNHTRGGGTSRTERYKSLGNSFQVDTVAYHLSVLKPLFPCGMNVLSLFSGIGGAEVALHRLGIPLNNVVSVEKSEVNQNILRCWWEQTNQMGNLVHLEDVQLLDTKKIASLIASIGGFDLVVGGSPCNNLAGSNRVSRDGLEGKESSLFFDYFRILEDVKNIMAARR